MIKNSLPQKKFILFSLLYFIFFSTSVMAFSFSPMNTSIGSLGADAVVTYTVTNDSDKQIAVTIKVMNRVIDNDGKETNTPANSSFLIFPSRVVLNPMTSQTVKVQYRGPGLITTESAYRVIAEQLPVDFAKSNGSAVNILLTYVAALYVSPPNALADVVIVNAVGGEKENQRGIMLTLQNKGTRHALIAKPSVQVAQGTTFAQFADDAASALNGQNILAGGERVIFLPWDSAVAGTVYEGTFRAEIE